MRDSKGEFYIHRAFVNVIDLRLRVDHRCHFRVTALLIRPKTIGGTIASAVVWECHSSGNCCHRSAIGNGGDSAISPWAFSALHCHHVA